MFVLFNNNMMSGTNGANNVCPSDAHAFTFGFQQRLWYSIVRISFLVLLYFLSYRDFRLLIAPLIWYKFSDCFKYIYIALLAFNFSFCLILKAAEVLVLFSCVFLCIVTFLIFQFWFTFRPQQNCLSELPVNI